jgi:mRNA interferase RelE/StbE
MKYQVLITRNAQKELSLIQKEEALKIKDKILKVAEDPRLSGAKKLKGRAGWRVRMGNYRIIYEIDDVSKEVLILHIGHRRDIYNL